ncbi:MAG: alpha/beta fold hydrolase [Clostridiales bacterium]|nr:alpha/beta fold hydrolase [Clostridiales bacterium]
MKARNIALTGLILSAGAVTGISFINKFVKMRAISKHITSPADYHCFKWTLGNIYYKKTGSGKPLLLIHDLHTASGSFEWDEMIPLLSKNYTVYAIDLLGFGISEKPDMTYTNYLFVQLISDFIKSEIGHRTNVITSGESASIPLMACTNHEELFDEMIFVNPPELLNFSRIPGKAAKCYKWFLMLPVVGTLTYHIAMSRKHLYHEWLEHTSSTLSVWNEKLMEESYESAHLGDSPKSVYASIHCNYTKCNMIQALKEMNHSICLIGGDKTDHIDYILKEYQVYNSSIETELIADTGKYPHIETPDQLYQLVQIYL